MYISLFIFVLVFNRPRKEMYRSLKIFPFLLLAVLLNNCAVNNVPTAQSLVIKLNLSPNARHVKNFHGFGTEWDSREYIGNKITDKDFELTKERIRYMKLPIVRTMMLARWCYDSTGVYRWNSPMMKQLYRILDFCEENNIAVMLCEWGIEPGWDWMRLGGGIKKVDDPRYAEIIGNYMDYLLNTKKYTCIKYFILVNEPNYEVGNFTRWMKGVQNVHDEFVKKGIDKKIIFAGSGQTWNEEWHYKTVDSLSNIINTYTIHRYESTSDLKNGRLFDYIRSQLKYIRQNDSTDSRKELIVSEAGMRDGMSVKKNINIDSFYYGVFMADYAIQATVAGSSSVLAWMLEDNSLPDFQYGLWADRFHEMKFRPWFYTWSLLTRYFPRGSEVYNLHPRSINQRAMAAKININGIDNWSVCLVNEDQEPVLIKIKLPDNKANDFKIFYYTEESQKVDKNGFPLPVENRQINISEGTDIQMPGNSVVIMTTLD